VERAQEKTKEREQIEMKTEFSGAPGSRGIALSGFR